MPPLGACLLRLLPRRFAHTLFLRAHVLGLAWSGPEDHHLAHVGRALVTQWADAAPHAVATLAAAGHDGPGRLRFPASCEAVLAVGVCDEAGRPVSWCGADAAPRPVVHQLSELIWLFQQGFVLQHQASHYAQFYKTWQDLHHPHTQHLLVRLFQDMV